MLWLCHCRIQALLIELLSDARCDGIGGTVMSIARQRGALCGVAHSNVTDVIIALEYV